MRNRVLIEKSTFHVDEAKAKMFNISSRAYKLCADALTR